VKIKTSKDIIALKTLCIEEIHQNRVDTKRRTSSREGGREQGKN
jgi:hypothetical protein